MPPTLFMRKRKVPILMERILTGTISTRTVNNRENQVSAEKYTYGFVLIQFKFLPTEKIVKEERYESYRWSKM